MRTAVLTKEVITYLAGRPDPMTIQIGNEAAKRKRGKAQAKPRKGRTVSTGSMPDFAYQGEGVKIMQVAEDSPGANAGLTPGDIIKSFGGVPIQDLRAYTAELKKYSPGDKVDIIIQRDGNTITLPLILAKR